MEPVTHMLTGACLSRAMGLPRRSAYATLACVVAAELPDADYVYRLGGPITYFQHHRGWTHAFWSLPLQALFVVGLMYAWNAIRRRRPDAVRMRPVLLWAAALLALFSHILLDWTNNYGVRPFAPFNPRWYSGDLVFIVEPVLLVVLALALLVPGILSLASSEIRGRRERSPGRGFATVALLVMAGLWCWRWFQHGTAIERAATGEYSGGAPVKISANPYPVNPFRWHLVVETPNNFVSGTADTRTGTLQFDQVPFPKPETTLQTLTAKHSRLGQIYLDWSQFPQVQQVGTAGEMHPELDLSPEEQRLAVVRFRDLRFLYDVLGFHGRSESALSAEAWVNDRRQVVRQSFGGSVQR